MTPYGDTCTHNEIPSQTHKPLYNFVHLVLSFVILKFIALPHDSSNSVQLAPSPNISQAVSKVLQYAGGQPSNLPSPGPDPSGAMQGNQRVG